MTKPSRPRRPRPDRTVDALLALVEGLLDDFFADPGNRRSYQILARGGRKAGVRTGETISIGSMELSDNGEAGLHIRVGSPEITLAITHPRFNANVAARYDLHTAMMTEARIIRIEGDRETAGKCADKWFEELAVSAFDDDDDTLDDALSAFLSGDGSPFDGEDDPGEPPPASPQDKAMVDVLAMALAREMKRKRPDMLAHEGSLRALEQSPQSLWPILDGLIAACTAGARDDALIDAWRFLLDHYKISSTESLALVVDLLFTFFSACLAVKLIWLFTDETLF